MLQQERPSFTPWRNFNKQTHQREKIFPQTKHTKHMENFVTSSVEKSPGQTYFKYNNTKKKLPEYTQKKWFQSKVEENFSIERHLIERESRSLSPKVQWNSSVRTKDSDVVKELKTKILDLTNENKKLRWEVRQCKKMQRQMIKTRLFPRHSQEIYQQMKIEDSEIATHPYRSTLSQNQAHSLRVQNFQLVNIIREMEQKTEELKAKVKRYEGDEMKKEKSLMKYCSDLQKFYEQKMNGLEERLTQMNKQLKENEESLKCLFLERSKQIQNTIQISKTCSEGLKKIQGDTEEAYEHQPEEEIGKINNFETSRIEIEKYTAMEREHESLINQMIRIKNQITQLKNENEKLREERKKDEGKEEDKKKTEKILKDTQRVKNILQACYEEAFETLHEEITFLMNKNNELQVQMEEQKEIKQGKKVWQVQKSLTDAKKKNKQLISKCIDLQKYIQNNIADYDKETFWTEGIFQNYYVHGCKCKKEGKVGEEALKWIQYLKMCIGESMDELSDILKDD